MIPIGPGGTGCGIGTTNFVTGSTSSNAFGENIGEGLQYTGPESREVLHGVQIPPRWISPCVDRYYSAYVRDSMVTILSQSVF